MSPNNMNMPANAREQLIAMLYGEMLTQQERMEAMQSRIEQSTKELQTLSGSKCEQKAIDMTRWFLIPLAFVAGIAFGGVAIP